MGTIEFAVLGPLEVVGPDGSIRLNASKERALLVALLGWAGQVMSTERLVEALWVDAPPRSSVKLVQNLVLSLRKLLGHEVIETCAGGYRLRVDAVAIDVAQWERLRREGHARADAGDWETAATLWSHAVSLWRGDPLLELSEWPPARDVASGFAEEQRALCEDLAEAELACGRHQQAIARLQQMVDEEPLRERRWSLLMLGLYRAGRQTDSLRAFQRVRSVLAELGLQPGPELVALERAVSVHDDSLIVVSGDRVDVFRLRDSHTLATHSSNLPFELNRFVGRASELATIERLIESSRLVTLIGVGGGGKSRLALRTGTNFTDRYPQGVWLLELAPMSDENGVAAGLAVVLGIDTSHSDGTDALEQLICDSLAPREVLLIFDNCEHLVTEIARLTRLLLTTCSRVSVLATSREVLGLPGEVVYQVPALALPSLDETDVENVAASDAVVLFCERASRAVPDFHLTKSNAGLVARICHKLEGIPLALELAAARTRVLSVQQILEHLDDSFGVLAGGPRTEALRHQTMRATLDWSYALLSPADRRSLITLAVFPGRFDLDAAIALVGDGRAAAGNVERAAALDTIARLVDKSLLVLEADIEPPRYRLLQPIRLYAADKLADAGEVETARRRHRDFFLGRSAAWLSDMDLDLRLLADLPNYRLALEWSWVEEDVEAALQLLVTQAQGWFWAGYPDAQEWIERVLTVAEPMDSLARVRALSRLALILHGSDGSAVEREQRLMLEAAMMAERLGDGAAIANTNWAWGELNVAHGNVGAGRRLIEDAERRYVQLDHATGVGWCEHSLGWVAMAAHDIESARGHFERALTLARDKAAGGFLLVHALAALSPILAATGEFRRGLQLAGEALTHARGYHVRAVLIVALVSAAETAMLGGAQQQSMGLLRELLSVLHDRLSLRWVADALDLTAVAITPTHPGSAVELICCAEIMRATAGEQLGGTRVIRAEIDATRARLHAGLGPKRFEEHSSRGANASPTAILLDAITLLDANETTRDAGSATTRFS